MDCMYGTLLSLGHSHSLRTPMATTAGPRPCPNKPLPFPTFASPLSLPLNSNSNSNSTSNSPPITPRRPTSPPLAIFNQSRTPSIPLPTALNQISTFSGDQTAARALILRLINDFSTPNATPNALPTLLAALSDASFLHAFSTLRSTIAVKHSQKRAVSADKLTATAGLPLSALSPKPSTVLAWQFAGVALVIAVVQAAHVLGLSHFTKPLLIGVGGLLVMDQVVLRGLLFEGVYRRLFPRYEEKVVKHEAGHFLAAYLYGLAVRGYVLSAGEAFQAGIPGQAGTLFEDAEMYEGLRVGKVGQGVIDRFSVVSMAGIAAEAVYYGEAEGGESDVESLLRLLTGLNPPWSVASVKSQARWAVLEAVLLIRENVDAYEALCAAMRERKSLGECILVIEDNFKRLEERDGTGLVSAETQGGGGGEQELERKEQAILAELEKIKKQVERFEGK